MKVLNIAVEPSVFIYMGLDCIGVRQNLQVENTRHNSGGRNCDWLRFDPFIDESWTAETVAALPAIVEPPPTMFPCAGGHQRKVQRLNR